MQRQILDWWKRNKSKENLCFYCGIKMTFVRDLPLPKTLATTDHIKPRANAGKNLPSNRVRCCLGCNGLKGRLSLNDFREALTGSVWGEFFGEKCYAERQRYLVLPNKREPLDLNP